MNKLKIHRGDSKQIRHSKKIANNKKKRKFKFYNPDSQPLLKVKRGKYHTTSRKQVKFSKAVETFCNVNLNFVKSNNRVVLKLDEDFSLFHNPGKVLISLVNFLKHAKTIKGNPKLVYGGHVSFGAIYLIDNLSWMIAKHRRWVVERKKFPPEEASILSNLKSIDSSMYEDENEYMINERVAISRNNPSANQEYRTRAKHITDLIEKGIKETSGDHEYTLPFEIHSAIKSTIGESFDNIQLHTDETEVGTLCAFYNKLEKVVTILIYNFGETIAQTFTGEDLPASMYSDIMKVINNHTHKNAIFNKTAEFTPENALTLLAIQEGISSKIQTDPSRGHGITDFIDNCFQLTDECEIVIISGRTAVKIDKTYKMSKENVFGRSRRIIAFNKHNDIFEKPDPKFVVNTGVYFNGVIIEAKIPLNPIKNG